MQACSNPSNAWPKLIVLAVLGVPSTAALGQDDGYVLYLSEYLHGDYFVAELGDVDRRRPRRISPVRLTLPDEYAGDFELGNADVFPADRRIVFAGRDTVNYDWGVFIGTIDMERQRILDVEPLAQTIGSREEDPRFSWDGAHVVYKCDGNICVYPEDYGTPVVVSPCELWAPAFDAAKSLITHAERCGAPSSDRIWLYDLVTGERTQIPNEGGGPDRFSHFLADGRVVYSHVDTARRTASLWVYEQHADTTMLLHDRTDSDDDPYPDKRDPNHVAFIGWGGKGYNLFLYRADQQSSVQMTRQGAVLGPVLFR